MKSFQKLRTEVAQFVNRKTTETTQMTKIDANINDSIRAMATTQSGNWWWLERTTDILTVANQEGYQIPNIVRKLSSVTITVGQQPYLPEPVFDPDKWNLLKESRLGVYDIPMFYYRENNRV